VTVRFWAGAQRAAGVETEQFEVQSVNDLRRLLAARPAMGRLSSVASFLVDGAQAGDDAPLPDGAAVDMLPPFAGG